MSVGLKAKPYDFRYLDDIIVVTDSFEEHVK